MYEQEEMGEVIARIRETFAWRKAALGPALAEVRAFEEAQGAALPEAYTGGICWRWGTAFPGRAVIPSSPSRRRGPDGRSRPFPLKESGFGRQKPGSRTRRKCGRSWTGIWS